MSPSAEVEIDAPLETVWRVVLDTPSYAAWNPFIVRADTPQPPTVGRPIVLHVVWRDGRRDVSKERISAIEPPATDDDGTATARFSYAYAAWPARLGLIRGTRHQWLIQRPGGPTSYHTVEDLSGPLARRAGPGRIADGFRRHAEALKARAEALALGAPD